MTSVSRGGDSAAVSVTHRVVASLAAITGSVPKGRNAAAMGIDPAASPRMRSAVRQGAKRGPIPTRRRPSNAARTAQSASGQRRAARADAATSHRSAARDSAASRRERASPTSRRSAHPGRRPALATAAARRAGNAVPVATAPGQLATACAVPAGTHWNAEGSAIPTRPAASAVSSASSAVESAARTTGRAADESSAAPRARSAVSTTGPAHDPTWLISPNV